MLPLQGRGAEFDSLADYMICTAHKHSSMRSAERCFMKTMERRIRIKTKSFKECQVMMVRHNPPREVVRGPVRMYIFIEDGNSPY